MKVLVTCPPMLGLFNEFKDVFTKFGVEGVAAQVTQVMSEEELIEILPDYDGWIIGDDPATRRVFEAAKSGNLRAAVKWGVGTDNVDFDACHNLGIPITNTPGVFGREVADVATAYVLGLARQTYLIDRSIRDGGWPKPAGVSLWNKMAGVVGYGDIGRATVKRLLALDLDVSVYDPYYKADGQQVTPKEWPNGLGALDFLIFTCPLTPQTHHMFNHDILPRLKPGVRIVNVSRGPVINESSLIEGLNSGIVHSAALDVFEVEPLAADNPLRGFERNIFGSHNGSNSVDAVRKVSHMAIEKIAEFLDS